MVWFSNAGDCGGSRDRPRGFSPDNTPNGGRSLIMLVVLLLPALVNSQSTPDCWSYVQGPEEPLFAGDTVTLTIKVHGEEDATPSVKALWQGNVCSYELKPSVATPCSPAGVPVVFENASHTEVTVTFDKDAVGDFYFDLVYGLANDTLRYGSCGWNVTVERSEQTGRGSIVAVDLYVVFLLVVCSVRM